MDPIRKKLLIAAFTILCFSFTAILLSLVCLWKIHRKKKKKNSEKLLTQADDQSLDAEKGVALSPSSFFAKCNSLSTLSLKGFASFIDYKMIKKATKNFDKINILDESGFKLVYKAILDNGTEVAVKKNEVKLLSRFHHSNVISSFGYSIENETGFVMYELMHNGSLETQLHGPSRGSQLSWHRRLKIALDIARGLKYLNELFIPPIIHRNLKPSNILLDSNFNAKISDFGMAAVVAGGGGKEGGLSRSLNFLGKTVPVVPESILNGEKLTCFSRYINRYERRLCFWCYTFGTCIRKKGFRNVGSIRAGMPCKMGQGCAHRQTCHAQCCGSRGQRHHECQPLKPGWSDSLSMP
ncbi:hypothetical protein ES332_A05G062500v1 [Gossypium tomentosum]|uniref:non-specific serine/threonine protein kinase n=1 Tax=Gossypium tomentosum TaxID=34277 RepID=A0A5D2QAW4_GOSTO|nr:hypothetical protein ES332_A05G062500v1 [Gossypium tomentosum]